MCRPQQDLKTWYDLLQLQDRDARLDVLCCLTPVISNDLFVIFISRPHSSSGCFQTGYVYKGQPKFDGATSSTCPTGPPKGAEWFHVKLTVSTATSASEVKVYMKGALVKSWNPRYPIKNRGGVLVANGYKNVVYYKNFHIQ